MNWKDYEKKRGALERKWSPVVQKALNAQVSSFIQGGMTNSGLDTHIHFGGVFPVIAEMYKDAARVFAALQYRELRSQAKPVKFSSQVIQTKTDDPWKTEVIRQLRISGLNLAQKISQTTKDEIMKILERAASEGWGADKTASEIVRTTQEVNRLRALTIARTELGRGANVAKVLAAKAMNLALDKIWITANDERVRGNPIGKRSRANHWILNEQSVGMDEKFSNGLFAPGDPRGGPDETINCRCTLVFKVVKDPDGNPVPRQYTISPLSPAAQVVSAITEGLTQTILSSIDELQTH